jgi:hypothetical protein
VVRIWQALQDTLTAASRSGTRSSERLLRLVRARLPNGERIVAVRFPEVLLDKAKTEVLRRAREAEDRAAAEATARIGGGGGEYGEGTSDAAASAAAAAAAAAARTLGPPPAEAPAPVDAAFFELITDNGAEAAMDEDEGAAAAMEEDEKGEEGEEEEVAAVTPRTRCRRGGSVGVGVGVGVGRRGGS